MDRLAHRNKAKEKIKQMYKDASNTMYPWHPITWLGDIDGYSQATIFTMLNELVEEGYLLKKKALYYRQVYVNLYRWNDKRGS